MSQGKLTFAESFVYLRGKLMKFEGRPYLRAIYDSRRNLVLRASRQVEKSSFLANTILFEAISRPGISILFVCPRQEQARMFFRDRLERAILESPLIYRGLLGKSSRRLLCTHTRFANGSSLYLRAAYHSADAVRGISADLLLVDEFQDIAPNDLPVLQEVLSHSQIGRTMLAGTPKMIDNPLEQMFQQSTANEWTIDCPSCRRGVILDERAMGAASIVCPKCKVSLDTSLGRWVARNAAATWGDGYWVNHLLVPWIDFADVLDRHRIYDLARFKNEVLGLSTSLGEHVVTRAELEMCCTLEPMASSVDDIPAWAAPYLTVGIDWGGGGTSRTVAVVGYMRSDYVFQICHIARFRSDEDPLQIVSCLTQLCRRFGACWIAADGGGNGHVLNRMLLDRLNYQPEHLYAILYLMSEHEPRQDGSLWKWAVNRSATIGALFTRVKKQSILFPRLEDCGTYLDEFACEFAEYDDVNRFVKYLHPTNQPDDALHAANYALILGTRVFQYVKGQG